MRRTGGRCGVVAIGVHPERREWELARVLETCAVAVAIDPYMPDGQADLQT